MLAVCMKSSYKEETMVLSLLLISSSMQSQYASSQTQMEPTIFTC